jgi:V8-like Glu-specific endopeptidase
LGGYLRGKIAISILAVVFSTPCFAIVNGVPLRFDAKPDVIRINIERTSIYDPQIQSESSCTAVVVDSDLIVTAGHCVSVSAEGKVTNLTYNQFLQNGSPVQIPSLKIYTKYVNEEFKDNRPNQWISGCSLTPKQVPTSKTPDLALIRFPPNTFSSFAIIDSGSELQVNDILEYYGYGIHESSFSSMIPYRSALPTDLRYATNMIWRMNSQRIVMKAETTANFADHGDSGAPLYRNGKVVAIMSTIDEHCETEYGSDYAILNTAVSLTTQEAVKFFEEGLANLQ